MSHSPSPASSPRQPRPTATASAQINYNLFNGGALDSQVTDTQVLEDLAEQNPPANKISEDHNNASFVSSGSSDTEYSDSDEQACWGSRQPDEDFDLVKKPIACLAVDDPMGEYSFPSSRPTTPDFIARYADLKKEDIQLSRTEARIIAAVRADIDSSLRQYAQVEQDRYTDLANMFNRIAVLESLLEYHRIPLPV